MLSEKTRDYLLDILDAITHINQTVRGRSVEDYLGSRDLQAIVERNLITIGEVLARLRDSDPETIDRITSHSEAIGLRNIIIHEYRRLDDRIVWRTVWEFLPIMDAECRMLIGESSPSMSGEDEPYVGDGGGAWPSR
ncbi:MAG: DUF86 domain-containing protein [Thermomicrobiales bacterium]